VKRHAYLNHMSDCTWRDVSFHFISFQFYSSSRSIIQENIFSLSMPTISKIVPIEYPTIILILTLSVPARSDFAYMTSSNTQSIVHVRGCGLYPNATKKCLIPKPLPRSTRGTTRDTTSSVGTSVTTARTCRVGSRYPGSSAAPGR